MRRPARRRQLRQLAPLAVGAAACLLLAAGVFLAPHLFGGGSTPGTTPVSVPGTTTSALPVAPIAPTNAQSGSGSASTSTFQLVLPATAAAVTRSGNSQNEELRFRLGSRQAVVLSQPSVPGQTLSEWVAAYSSQNVSVKPFQLDERKGFLVGEAAGRSYALMAVFLHGSQLYSIQLVAPTAELAATRTELLRLVAALKPR